MLTFVLNPVAGGGKGARVERDLRSTLSEVSIPSRVVLTERPGHAIELTSQHAADSRAVVAVGGDGTVNEVATALLRLDDPPPLGVVPVGTGNDFAWMLGMSRKPSHAVSQILAARPETIDYGIVQWRVAHETEWTKRAFLNAVGAGFDGLVTVRASRYKHLGSRVAYLAAIFSALRSWKGAESRIRLSGPGADEMAFPLLLACASNGRRHGGAYYLTPTADLTDGLLDVCLIRDMPTRRIIRLLPKAMSGNHTGAPEAELRKVTDMSFTTETPLALHVDGEIVALDIVEMEVKVVPGGIVVLATGDRESRRGSRV